MEKHPSIISGPGPEIREDGRCVPETARVCPLPAFHGAGRADAAGGVSRRLYGYPLATVYAPVQTFDRLYDPCTALARGTLFEDLDKPLETAHDGHGLASRGIRERGVRSRAGTDGRGCGCDPVCGDAVPVLGRG